MIYKIKKDFKKNKKNKDNKNFHSKIMSVKEKIFAQIEIPMILVLKKIELL